MVSCRSFSAVGRGSLLVVLTTLSACGTFDRVDESADKAVARVEVAADRALDAAASRASALVAESVTRAEAAAGRLLDRASTTLTASVERLPAALAAGLKQQTDAAASRAADRTAALLPEGDRAAFKRDVAENGLLKALRDWWLEIVLSFLGAGGMLRAWLASRRSKRDRTLAEVAVESIEEIGDEKIKQRVSEKTGGLGDAIHKEISARVQEIVRKAKHGKSS